MSTSSSVYPTRAFRKWHRAKDFLIRLLEQRWLFRGQAHAQWALLTSLDRVDHSRRKRIESYLIYEFKRSAIHYLAPNLVPTNTLEWLALMQHYGTPTRLLDFTVSPYIAAYIAASGTNQQFDKFAIWALNPAIFKGKAIRRINEKSAVDLAEFKKPLTDDKRFDEIFMQSRHNIVYPVEPYLLNERYRLQQAHFLISGNVGQTFDQNLLSTIGREKMEEALIRVELPYIEKAAVLYELNSMGINSSTLFPGLDGFARLLKEQTYYFERLDPRK